MDRKALLLGFLAADPSDSFSRYALALELGKEGDRAGQIAMFEDLLRRDRTYSGAYYHLGKALEADGRAEEAVAVYETGIQVATEVGQGHHRAELQSALAEARDRLEGHDPFDL